ncbi:MAG: hypothetical protein J0I84_15360, partial [Terrimonas sp.]|nr:hypothetical protein [Terrimonas sp.]
MKSFLITAVFFCFTASFVNAQSVKVFTSDTTYLSSLHQLFKAQWPNNRTINIVFHGHSVPAGYFKTPDIKTLEAYP